MSDKDAAPAQTFDPMNIDEIDAHIADEYDKMLVRPAAPAPAVELPPLPRLTGLLDEVFSATGLMEKAAFNDYVRSYARAAVEQIVRERDEALEANAGLDKRMRTLDEKLFYAERERDSAREYGTQARIRENRAEDKRIHEHDRAERAERENAELRKDAERYRWLQREIDMGRLAANHPEIIDVVYASEDGNALDAAIDAAREGKCSTAPVEPRLRLA